MDALVALMTSGTLSLIDLVLVAIIGVLVYMMTVRQKASENQLNNTVNGMKLLLEEERHQTEALSKTVYEIRKEMKHEQDKNFELREEILALKNENLRLQNLVTQMEALVKQYQAELAMYKGGDK